MSRDAAFGSLGPDGGAGEAGAPGGGPAGAPLLSVRGLSKAFGDTQALRGLNLEARRGEIHAVVGENGSGKSTLVKVVAGVLRADSGEIAIDGHPVGRYSPHGIHDLGIAVVFQEVLTVASASVIDNVYLGFDELFRQRLSRRRKAERCAEVLDRLAGQSIDVEAPVGDLPLSTRQWITVARALVRDPQILILDESTAALDLSDAARLLAELEALKERGACVVLVTHRLTELQRIADRATVLRDGADVGVLERIEMNEQRLVELMTGQAFEVAHRPAGTGARHQGEDVMRVQSLRLAPNGSDISASFSAGEIVGMAGLEGEGQVAFLQALAGVRNPVSGTVEVHNGHTAAQVDDERAAERNGIVYVPGDRKAEGILPNQSILENFGLPSYGSSSRAGLIRTRAIKRLFAKHTEPLALTSGRVSNPITTLSGGNQQKVVIARWLARGPRMVLLNDPTRGVDIVTKRELYTAFRELASAGKTVLFLSTEIEELVNLCDRILVFREQAVASELTGETSAEDVVAAMFGVGRSADADKVMAEAIAARTGQRPTTPMGTGR